jgi:hypothetical protein
MSSLQCLKRVQLEVLQKGLDMGHQCRVVVDEGSKVVST